MCVCVWNDWITFRLLSSSSQCLWHCCRGNGGEEKKSQLIIIIIINNIDGFHICATNESESERKKENKIHSTRRRQMHTHTHTYTIELDSNCFHVGWEKEFSFQYLCGDCHHQHTNNANAPKNIHGHHHQDKLYPAKKSW